VLEGIKIPSLRINYKCTIKNKKVMNDLKRFYNENTTSILRVQPLFQRWNPYTKKKLIIGISYDTDFLDRDCGGIFLKKGCMVLLTEPSKKFPKIYKGEPLLELIEVIWEWDVFLMENNFVNDNPYCFGNMELLWRNYSE